MFKQTFKYYKSKQPQPNFDDVLDIDKNNHTIEFFRLELTSKSSAEYLRNTKEWQVYVFPAYPGLIYIRNPFTVQGQRYWIRQSLQEFTKKPNRLNIDALNIVPEDYNWWDYAQTRPDVLRRLRWATLGYHHNWDTKIYSEDARNTFPSNLHQLCAHFATVLHFEAFNAEAAIVNFYQMDSILSGHTDHSENCLDAPLFSFSFGNTAIFLLGGQTLDEKPLALFLHSGDVLVMSKASRLCYHAVPRIVESSHKSWLTSNNSETDFQPFANYMETARININVRQVLRSGESRLEAN